jgi:hypothetical protein
MGLLGWFRRNREHDDLPLSEWRRAWAAAFAAPDQAAVDELTAELSRLDRPDEEIEIEREMLDALRDLLRLRSEAAGGLPVVETYHRVIGTDRCHFTAPVSMPDEAEQPSGRLLLTERRAIFVGAGRSTAVPWHAVGEARHADRDLLLVRSDRTALYRFRCNTYSDAVCGAFLAGQLAAPRQRSTPRTHARSSS